MLERTRKWFHWLCSCKFDVPSSAELLSENLALEEQNERLRKILDALGRGASAAAKGCDVSVVIHNGKDFVS